MNPVDIWRIALKLVGNTVGAERTNEILLMVERIQEGHQSLSKIYERFCVSAQNRTMLPGVIGWIEENPDMRTALANFDLSVTGDWNEGKFYMTLTRETARGRRADLSRPNNLWRQFSRSLADITQFLKQFEHVDGSADRFRKHVLENSRTKETAWALAVSISDGIRGMGPTLVCDALKETGSTNFSKPDTHIKDIFKTLGLSNSSDDENVFYALWDFAAEVGASPSQVDKIFWLIGSGKFYMFKETYPSMKQKLFSMVGQTQA